LAPDLLSSPFKDRLTGHGVSFRRNADGFLEAQGDLIDVLASLPSD
jgi:hypothetical protein